MLTLGCKCWNAFAGEGCPAELQLNPNPVKSDYKRSGNEETFAVQLFLKDHHAKTQDIYLSSLQARELADGLLKLYEEIKIRYVQLAFDTCKRPKHCGKA